MGWGGGNLEKRIKLGRKVSKYRLLENESERDRERGIKEKTE